MTFIRLTTRQFRLASLVVALALIVNMVVPGFATFASDDCCANPDAAAVAAYNGIDEYGSESGADPTVSYDDLENSEPNSDNCDDCMLRSVTFSIDRGEYFGPVTTRSFFDHHPAPEHRPPNRR